MNLNKKNNLMSIYKQIDQNNYEKLEPIMLKISKILDTGIVSPKLEKYFQEDYQFKNFGISMFSSLLRNNYIKEFGFFLITEKFLNTCVELFSNEKILDIGAGSGFLSHNLISQNLDVKPIDLHINESNQYGFKKTYCDIINMSGKDYIKKNNNYDTIILSWPNYDNNFAYDILKLMPKGKKLLYIGENQGGCTANDLFFELLEEKTSILEYETEKLQKCSLSWFGIHDKPYLYKVI